jgi:hypothetical protein
MTTQTVSSAGSGLVFVNTYTADDTQQYIDCIVAAETQLESLFTNSVTINITFDEVNQGNTGFLATNQWSFVDVSYSQLESVIPAADALPATDPTGGHTWTLPDAYARMLGLSSYIPTTDQTITLNTYNDFSYGQDVINLVEHEITEGSMGRVGGLGDQNSAWSTMDLFRYSAPGIRDFTDGRDGLTTYFSSNGNVLSSLSFNNQYIDSTHVNTADVADFTQQDVFGTGEGNNLSSTDITVMNALGWTHSHSVFPFSNDPQSQIEMIYIAYFGRAGDPDGTNYWVNELNAGGDTVISGLTGVAAAYSLAPEASAEYPLLANPSAASQTDIQTSINAIYQNLFDRTADAAGLAYWTAEVNGIIATHNSLTIANGIGQMAVSIALAAQGTDQITLANKATVAQWLTQQYEAAGVNSFPTQSAEFAFAHSLIASVTSDQATVIGAEMQHIPLV